MTTILGGISRTDLLVAAPGVVAMQPDQTMQPFILVIKDLINDHRVFKAGNRPKGSEWNGTYLRPTH